ncbi:MAG: hypothetical protein CMH54_13915 [Myxococcales bacterium]|nr:hypothetical protein [Myxococcales bacterium]
MRTLISSPSILLVLAVFLACGQSTETYDPDLPPDQEGSLDTSGFDGSTLDGGTTLDTNANTDTAAGDTGNPTDTGASTDTNGNGSADTSTNAEDTSTNAKDTSSNTNSDTSSASDSSTNDSSGQDSAATDTLPGDVVGVDSTSADSAGGDASTDGGSPLVDGVLDDAISNVDGASEDIGGIIDDGTVVDVALPPDTNGVPPIQPDVALTCDSTLSQIYEFPGNLPSFDPSQRGAVVLCSTGFTVTQSTAQAQLISIPGLDVISGYKEYHLAYRTERAPGVPGLGTARMLVPDSAVPGPRPTVVFAHGTAGLGDNCTPSKGLVTGSIENLVTWAASGYVVIAPDYAGLGTPGVQGYGNHKDSAHSVIDAARAARAMLTPGSVDGTFVVAGHSQGGGIALNVHGYAKDYAGPDLELLGAVSFAGSIKENTSILGLHYPHLVSLLGGAGVRRAVFALSLYADWANTAGESAAGDIYHPAVSDTILPAIEGNCIYQIVSILAGSVGTYTAPNTLEELMNPTILADVVDCFASGNCTTGTQAFLDRLMDNQPLFDPDGPALLVISAENDVQSTPSKQSCTLDLLEENGVEADSCLFADLTHYDLIRGSIGHAIAWVKAIHSGGILPNCPSSLTYPTCE